MNVGFGVPLKTGTVVTLWHGNRGKLYVIAGYERRTKSITLVAHNSINSDGSIHAATSAATRNAINRGSKLPESIKTIGYEEFVEGVLVAPKLNRVYGERTINRDAITKFIREDLQSATMKALSSKQEIYPSIDITADARTVAYYA